MLLVSLDEGDADEDEEEQDSDSWAEEEKEEEEEKGGRGIRTSSGRSGLMVLGSRGAHAASADSVCGLM